MAETTGMSTDTDRLAEIRRRHFIDGDSEAFFLLCLIDERDAAAADLQAWGHALERELVATQVERDHLLNAAQRRAHSARQSALDEAAEVARAERHLADDGTECPVAEQIEHNIRSLMAPKGEGG